MIAGSDPSETAMDVVLTVTETPSERAKEAIERGLNNYNAEQAGYWDWRGPAVVISEPGPSEGLGGLLGRTSLGLLFIDLGVLPDPLPAAGLSDPTPGR